MILGPKDYKNILINYSSSLNQLRDWGINIPETSRLVKYQDTFESITEGSVPSDFETLVQISFIIKEIDEITKIVNSIEQNPNSATIDKLNHLKKDTLIQHQNNTNIEARNTQFELYLRYQIINSGMKCSIGNPDLKVSFDEYEIEIEAKRPNHNGLDFNLRKGLKQLSPEKPGILVFSLDHLLFRDNDFILLDNDEMEENGMDFLQQKVDEWSYKNRPSILRRASAKKSAIGMMFHARVPILKKNNLNFITIGSFKKMVPFYHPETPSYIKTKTFFDNFKLKI